MKFTIIMDKNALKKRSKAFEEAQDYLDSECLKLMTLYVPVAKSKYKNAGKLRDSGKVESPGVIVYTAPKARHDYYNDEVDHRNGGNPNACRLWFEVMKAKHSEELIRGVCKITGGRRS
jgi:hypothetical protein